MANLLAAADGDSIYRNSSMFSGKLGEQVAGENITMIDDGTMVFDHDLEDGTKLRVGGFGTSPFDGDGLPTRRTVVIERGVLKHLMLNTYTARKLAMQSTARPRAGLRALPASAAATLSGARRAHTRASHRAGSPPASTFCRRWATASIW